METSQRQVKVTFSIESRPSNITQKEAGKRLFSSLMTRAQTTAKVGAQVVAEAPPAVNTENPPSLTNRGDSTYKC
jgi:hypothetical protein